MCCSPKPKITSPKKKVCGALMGDLSPEERQRYIVRANIASDRRAAIEHKRSYEQHALPQQKNSFFDRLRQLVSH